MVGKDITENKAKRKKERKKQTNKQRRYSGGTGRNMEASG
jgi:hypothetical protein